jgi:hypothetical protein
MLELLPLLLLLQEVEQLHLLQSLSATFLSPAQLNKMQNQLYKIEKMGGDVDDVAFVC